MVMTVLRSMAVQGDEILFEACWPEGPSFQLALSRRDLELRKFPWLRGGATRRCPVRQLVVVESPDKTLTLLLADTPGRARRLARKALRYLTGQYSPLPLDNHEIGTSWGSVEPETLYRELDRLGIQVHRTTWDAYLPEV
jgi:hypothetical protein